MKVFSPARWTWRIDGRRWRAHCRWKRRRSCRDIDSNLERSTRCFFWGRTGHRVTVTGLPKAWRVSGICCNQPKQTRTVQECLSNRCRSETDLLDSYPRVNGNRKPHICGNRKLHTSGENVSGGADILPVMPVGRVGLDAGSGATGVLANTRREAAEPAVTWRLPHAVRPTLSSASADAPASGSCCPGC